LVREYNDSTGSGEEVVNGGETWLLKKALELAKEKHIGNLIENKEKVEGIESVREVYLEFEVDQLLREFER
jgi:hypothetical protein